MNNEIEKELKQDGQAIRELAAKRLADDDFAQKLMQTTFKPQKEKSPSYKWWGMAAAVCLVLIAITNYQLSEPMTQQGLPHIMVNEPVYLNIKALPEKIEKGLHDPLAKEQQAIIDDIKLFSKKLITI